VEESGCFVNLNRPEDLAAFSPALDQFLLISSRNG